MGGSYAYSGVDEVVGGVYAGVVVVGSSFGAEPEPEPSDHVPWRTPAVRLPPVNALKTPSVRSRPP